MGAIQKLRDQGLIDFADAVIALGNGALADPSSAGRGVTTARVTVVRAARDAFNRLKNAPRGQIVNRSTLRRELETRVAALMEAAADLDDLSIQFDEDAAARRFTSAWKQARQIVDAGHGHGSEDDEEGADDPAGPGASGPAIPPPPQA